MGDQTYLVRAMPAQGHERRWCAQRPFTKSPVEVKVTNTPAPHRLLVEHGVVTQRIAQYSYEMTPAEFEELQRDARLAITIKGDPNMDPLELNSSKAKVIELEKKLEAAAKLHQEDVEALKAFQVGADKEAEASGAELAKVKSELEQLRQLQLSQKMTATPREASDQGGKRSK